MRSLLERPVFGVVAAAMLVILIAGGTVERPAAADWDPRWAAIRVSGDVQARVGDGQPGRQIEPMMILPVGSIVTTGSGGTATLVLGHDTIEVGADTTITLPAPAEGSADTEILQTTGSAVYTVNPGVQRTFEVRTPLLVTLVRGTSFAVSVGAGQAAVNVTEGRVTVSEVNGGRSVDVDAGFTATVDDDDESGISVSESPAGPTGSASQADDPDLDTDDDADPRDADEDGRDDDDDDRDDDDRDDNDRDDNDRDDNDRDDNDRDDNDRDDNDRDDNDRDDNDRDDNDRDDNDRDDNDRDDNDRDDDDDDD